jgi:hypothetical protein
MWARGESNQTYTGTVEWGFEVSAFHPNGNCSRPAYWFDSDTPGGGEILQRWLDLGRPRAMRVTFVGDLSSLGRWGHIGGYIRQIRAVKLIDASAADARCACCQ